MLFWMLLMSCGKDDASLSFSTITLDLVNPAGVDVLQGVETLRLSVLQSGDLIAEAEFSPDEDTYAQEENPPLEDLQVYGEVEFHLAGVDAGGTVVSFGRTGVVEVSENQNDAFRMIFLPVNEFFPMSSGVLTAREGHWTGTVGGQLLIIGGEQVSSGQLTTEVFDYDPGQAKFSLSGNQLPAATRDLEGAVTSRGTVFLTGGTDGMGSPQGQAYLYSPAEGFEDLGPLAGSRERHCLGISGAYGAIIGGGSLDVELLENSGESYSWTTANLMHLDPMSFDPTLVDRCDAPHGEGALFVLGSSAASTGLFDLVNLTMTQPVPDPEGVQPLSGGMVKSLSASEVWIGGGQLIGPDGPAGPNTSSWTVDLDSMTSSPGPSLSERVNGSVEEWTQPGWLVTGCGESSTGGSNTSVELFRSDSAGPELTLSMDSSRLNCTLSVAGDGTLVIVGDEGSFGEPAAMAVPYLEGSL